MSIKAITLLILVLTVTPVSLMILETQQAQAFTVYRRWSGKVTWVTDGDTLTIGGKTVRLALTDAYELGTTRGEYAKGYVINQCYGKTATVTVDARQPKDAFGRTVAEVNCPTAFLNYQILRSGYGKIDKQFCPLSSFSAEWWAKLYGC